MALNHLQKWENQHWYFVFEELREAGINITTENIPRIIAHMSFAERSRRNPDRCTYYPKGIPCHPEIENLNCLLCACPNYDSSTSEGACKSSSKRGFYYHSAKNPKIKVWDCSNCSRYHSPKEVRHFLGRNIAKLLRMSETL